MAKNATDAHFRLDPRAYSILESVRDENLLPTLSAAINYLIKDYSRLRDLENGSHPKLVPSVDNSKI